MAVSSTSRAAAGLPCKMRAALRGQHGSQGVRGPGPGGAHPGQAGRLPGQAFGTQQGVSLEFGQRRGGERRGRLLVITCCRQVAGPPGRCFTRERRGGPAVHLDDQMRDRGVQHGLADQVMPEPDQPRPGRQQADVHAPGQRVMDDAVLAASGLQMTLPSWLAFGPHWLLPALEIGRLSALVASSPGRLERRSAALRAGGLALAGLLSLTNATFAILLIGDLARGGGTRSAAALLLAGGALWTANVLIFALWYWELDRGGPADRCHAVRP